MVATAPHEVRLETRSACTEAVVPPRLRGTGAPALPIDRGTNTLRDCRDQALLAFCSGELRWSDFSSVKFSCTGVFGSGRQASGGQAAPRGRARSNWMLKRALLWLLSCASKKVTAGRGAPGGLSRRENTAKKKQKNAKPSRS